MFYSRLQSKRLKIRIEIRLFMHSVIVRYVHYRKETFGPLDGEWLELNSDLNSQITKCFLHDASFSKHNIQCIIEKYVLSFLILAPLWLGHNIKIYYNTYSTFLCCATTFWSALCIINELCVPFSGNCCFYLMAIFCPSYFTAADLCLNWIFHSCKCYI